MALPPLLVDTNILLRIAEFDHHQDETLLAAIQHRRTTHTLCVTIQNVAEFWNVATRPQKQNGFGRSIAEAAAETDSIARHFLILPETQDTYTRWRTLVEDYAVMGILVHDARLAAIMLEYQISQILTLNARDFARFPFVRTLDPWQVN